MGGPGESPLAWPSDQVERFLPLPLLLLPPVGCRALEHDGLSCRRLTLRHFTMRSASGTNSLHSRITSGVQRSAASGACADAGVDPATNKTARAPAAVPKIAPDKFHFEFFMIELRPQYCAEMGSSSAGNRLMTVWPLSVTTTSSSMRAAE